MIINPVISLVAKRRCQQCGALLRVPVGLLKLPTWVCGQCVYDHKVAEVKRMRREGALRKKHGWDLVPRSGMPTR